MRLVYDETSVQPVGEPEKIKEEATPTAAFNLSRKIVASSGFQYDAFLLGNEDQLVANCAKMAQTYPKIQPYFDVSCNLCPWLLETLASLDIKFACQNKIEIQHVLKNEINPKNLIFANPIKISSHIKAALAHKADLMVFDSFNELKKIQKNGAGAKLLLALHVPVGNPERDRLWLELLNEAKDLGLDVVGVSLQKTSEEKGCNSKGYFNKMMALAKMAFTIGRSLGHEMKILDVGLMTFLDKETFEQSLTKHFGGLQPELIGHLGSDFIENVFSVSAKIIGKRTGYEGQKSLIINEGIYNSFGRLLVDENYTIGDVKSLKSVQKGLHHALVDIFGSSGDDMDVIAQDLELDHDVEENDWIFFPKMGAYSIGISTEVTSLKLPSKFGNFWLFCTENDLENEDLENLPNLSLDVTIPDESLEVIFLDVERNLSKEQQKCLDLFEELPNNQFWEDFFNANR